MAGDKKLTQTETIELIKEAQTGSEEVLEQLIKANEKLIWKIVGEFNTNFNQTLDENDMFQIGAAALVSCIKNFDTTRDVKFSTYAYPTIKGEIMNQVKIDKGIHITRMIQETYPKILRNELENSSPEHVSKVLNVSLNIARDSLNYIRDKELKSMDEIVADSGQGDTLCLNEIISKDLNEGWFDRLALKDALDSLCERERSIITLRYLNGATQEEIAKELGYTKTWVNILRNRALENLRKKLA